MGELQPILLNQILIEIFKLILSPCGNTPVGYAVGNIHINNTLTNNIVNAHRQILTAHYGLCWILLIFVEI